MMQQTVCLIKKESRKAREESDEVLLRLQEGLEDAKAGRIRRVR